MDERRSKTLDALSAFIQSQRALLAQTQSDIEKLQEIREEIANEPEDLDVAYFLKEISAGTSRLSEQPDITATLPDDFDWSLFGSHDPSPFKSLASSFMQSNEKLTKGLPQPASSTPAHSSLLQMVRDRRRTTIDPILASIPPLSSDEEEDPPDPEELKKIREREKIKELKLRRINGGSGLSILGTRKPRTSNGVFVRKDLEDESAEVDVWGEEKSQAGRLGRRVEETTFSEPGTTMDVDAPPTLVTTPIKSPSPVVKISVPVGSIRPKRSTRGASSATAASASVRQSQGKAKQILKEEKNDRSLTPEANAGADEDALPSKSHDQLFDKKGKARPETYKQAWSMSEQHLLERLLEEIPDGEKNRWAKISKAMNGRRTARQVASRVQKYYEKLKRFGLDVDA